MSLNWRLFRVTTTLKLQINIAMMDWHTIRSKAVQVGAKIRVAPLKVTVKPFAHFIHELELVIVSARMSCPAETQ